MNSDSAKASAPILPDICRDILTYLESAQSDNGEFRSQCYLPTAEQPQWYYSGPSPFLTSNILYSIQEIPGEQAARIRKKGLAFLQSLQEKFGLWRYWEHNSPIMEYNVPNDLDDTCLVSWLLQKNGLPVPDNKALVKAQIRPDGDIYTWFLPRTVHLRHLGALPYLWKERQLSRPVFAPNDKIPNREPISDRKDREGGVESHALLYLGRIPETENTFKKLLREIAAGTTALQYYDFPAAVHYHFSRLSGEGWTGFEPVREAILSEAGQAPFSYDFHPDHLRHVMSALSMLNLNWLEAPVLQKLMAFLEQDPMLQNGWKPYKYWTSKQRSWWAGSPELTASLYLEAFYKNHNRGGHS